MRQKFQIVPVVIITLCVVAISLIGQQATNSQGAWFTSLTKPSWNPPNWLFAPVWTTIYLLLIISASIIWHRAKVYERGPLMRLYAINAVFNLAWSFCFFQAESTALGLADIILVWVTVLMLVIKTWPVSRAASLMLMPYLLWVTFATALNYSIMRLN
jgi:tryptophan-rich sensory protein